MKYPRTFHLTISDGATNDDKKLEKDDIFLNKNIIITSKLDGSNLCFTNTDCFARSHSGPPTHKSFDLAKQFHREKGYLIPEGYSVFMEYCYAKHSISYSNLSSYFNIFNIYDEVNDIWLSWEEVKLLSADLDIPTVPELFKGKFKKLSDFHSKIESLVKEKEFGIDEREGVVVRLAGSFKNEDFKTSVVKWVKANFVQTDEHWSHQEITKNKLK